MSKHGGSGLDNSRAKNLMSRMPGRDEMILLHQARVAEDERRRCEREAAARRQLAPTSSTIPAAPAPSKARTHPCARSGCTRLAVARHKYCSAACYLEAIRYAAAERREEDDNDG